MSTDISEREILSIENCTVVTSLGETEPGRPGPDVPAIQVSVTTRGVNQTEPDGSFYMTTYGAIVDHGYDDSGDIPYLWIEYDVNKSVGCVNDLLREYVIRFHKEAENGGEENTDGEVDFSDYDTPYVLRETFTCESNPSLIEEMYKLVTEGVSGLNQEEEPEQEQEQEQDQEQEQEQEQEEAEQDE